MLEELRRYYEQELGLLGDLIDDFGRKYPKAAERLSLSGGHSEDMHVQRMLQAFSLLAARARMKLGSGAPKFSEALLDVLHPHYLRPFPASSIACFEVSQPPSAPLVIKSGTRLTSPSGKLRFRTVYDVTAAPVRIADVRVAPSTVAPGRASLPPDTTLIVSITFERTGAAANLSLAMPAVARVHLAGQSQTITALADMLLMRTHRAFVEANGTGQWAALERLPLTAAGFAQNDALLPGDGPSASFVRPLLEYMAFPQKFDFIDFDTAALLKACRTREPMRITLHLAVALHPDSRAARALAGLSSHHFRLFCTPVVNLFERANVMALHGELAPDYPVVPSAEPETEEIYAIRGVRDAADKSVIPPYNALAHATARVDARGCYWLQRRDEYQARNNTGYETSLILLQEDGKAAEQWPEKIQIDVTCTHRHLPGLLKIGDPLGDLRDEQGAAGSRITLLRQPSRTFRPVNEEEARMRIIALTPPNPVQLSPEGWAELRRILRQCMPPGTHAQHVDAVSFVHTRRVQQLFPGKPNASIISGLEITLSLDEQAFLEHSMAAFIGVMDRYFARYAPANSFTQLVVLSRTNGAEIRRCPFRAGRSPLI